MRLTREVRTWLGKTSIPEDRRGGNSWAGTHDEIPLGRFVTVRVTVSGDPDARTGYVCDLRLLNELAQQVVRWVVAPAMIRSEVRMAWFTPALANAFQRASMDAPAGTTLSSIELLLSPFTKFTVEGGAPTMLKLTQSFEFSASHRLAIPTLSDDENRELFGKCSNVEGHGHNYVFEVTVAAEAVGPEGTVVRIGHLDRVVRETIVEPFDHKNLNTQCPEFADINPTVENIARVIFARLSDQFEGYRLDRVRVWETPKTSAEVDSTRRPSSK